MSFTDKALLAWRLTELVVVPPDQHAARTADAVGTLIALKAQASDAARQLYKQHLGAGVEPWGAFAAGGPGDPPAAVELLRPPVDDASSWSTLFSLWKSWTAPGLMATLLKEALPDVDQALVNTNVSGAVVAGADLAFTAKAVLAWKVVKLTATPDPDRAALTPDAAQVLGELKAQATPEGSKAYAQQLGAGVEPWAAFVSGGGGKPPAAAELLRPASASGKSWTLYELFKSWTSPGMIAGILVDGKLPGNPLRDVLEETTTRALGAISEGLATVAKVVGGVLAVGVLGFLAYKVATRPKPRVRGLPRGRQDRYEDRFEDDRALRPSRLAMIDVDELDQE